MSSKYFAHFIAAADTVSDGAEWSGVLEVTRPLRATAELRELSLLLARSFDVAPERILVLDWSRLH
jgi:hypothetical protein